MLNVKWERAQKVSCKDKKMKSHFSVRDILSVPCKVEKQYMGKIKMAANFKYTSWKRSK